MSSVPAQVSAPRAGMRGQPLTEAEVPARSKATGAVWRHGDDGGRLSSGTNGGKTQRSPECREQNRSYRGHGGHGGHRLRMLQSKATFDNSGGYGPDDTFTCSDTQPKCQIYCSLRKQCFPLGVFIFIFL